MNDTALESKYIIDGDVVNNILYIQSHKLTLVTIKPKKMKSVCCRDLGNDCDFTVSGEVEEVMDAVARHAKMFHKIDVTPEVAEAVKGVMKDV